MKAWGGRGTSVHKWYFLFSLRQNRASGLKESQSGLKNITVVSRRKKNDRRGQTDSRNNAS